MPAEKILKPDTDQIPALRKTVSLFKNIKGIFGKRKKLIIGIIVIIVLFFVYNILSARSLAQNSTKVKTVVTQIDKSFDFAAISSTGKPTGSKIKLKLANAEKTSQVQVKDQVFSAKNQKMFLIINLELKNDSTNGQNLIPGDLVRLAVSGNEDNKFAPDLHNNLVLVAPISTKLDRVGFVIPQEAKEFKLYLGEIEGKKEEIAISFPS